MKLNSVNLKVPVPKSHDFALFRFRGDFETVGKCFPLYDERVISRRFEGGGNVFKQILSVMKHGGSLSVHEPVRTYDLTAVDLADTLVPEANPENGHFLSEFLNDRTTDPRFGRSAGPGGDADSGGRFFPDLFKSDLVVAMDLHFHTQFSKVLNQVVGEGIVVVDHEQHNRECRSRFFRGQLSLYASRFRNRFTRRNMP